MNRHKMWTGMLGAAGLLAMAGCDMLTREHFELITVDVSTDDDVRHTIGEPDTELGDQWHYERPERHLNVMIDFNDQKVVARKQWIDADKSVWLDSGADESQTHESTTIREVR